VQTFVAALDTMFGGFRKRADHTYALLSDRTTTFIVVAAPERDALREASYFVDRLEEEQMPLAGLVVNRMYRVSARGLSAARALGAAEELGDEDSISSPGASQTTAITQGLLRMHAVQAEIAARHESLARRFVAGHPDIPVVEVPAASGDIHDLVGLRAVGGALAGL
jgi:anion-transporting  ArsA/GET3 family ATPase